MTDRDDLRADKALQGMSFPASKTELLDYARTREPSPKTLQSLQALPDREFQNKDEVIDSVPQEPEGTETPGGTAR